MSNYPRGKILNYRGTNYYLRFVGGGGWLRGCNSIVEALDGSNKGKFYRADVGKGIYNLKCEIKISQEEIETLIKKSPFNQCFFSNQDVSEAFILFMTWGHSYYEE